MRRIAEVKRSPDESGQGTLKRNSKAGIKINFNEQ